MFVLSEGAHVNVVLMGTAADSRLSLYPIDRSPLEAGYGTSRVTLIHAVAGGDPLTVTAADAGGSTLTLAENLAFGMSATFELTAGSYLLNAGDVVVDVPLNSNGDMTFAVFVIGAADGSQPVETRVFTNATLDETPTGHARFVHAMPSEPDGLAVDLYLNEILVSAGLAYGRATFYFGLVPGTYMAAVYTAGDDPASATPLFTDELVIIENEYQTAVWVNGVDAPTLFTVTDDMSAPPERSSGMAVINALGESLGAEGLGGGLNPQIDGVGEFADLAPGGISPRITLPEDSHDLVISGDAATHELTAFVVSPVTIANLKTLIYTAEGMITLTDCPAES